MLSNCGVGKDSESPLVSKEIQPVTPKGNQPWILVGRTDAEALILGPLMWRANSLEKTLILGKIDVEGEEGDRGWNGYMASQIQWKWTWVKSKDNKGQGGLARYSPWGHKESDMTNWTIIATWWEPFAHLIKAFPCLTMSGLQLWKWLVGFFHTVQYNLL